MLQIRVVKNMAKKRTSACKTCRFCSVSEGRSLWNFLSFSRVRILIIPVVYSVFSVFSYSKTLLKNVHAVFLRVDLRGFHIIVKQPRENDSYPRVIKVWN